MRKLIAIAVVIMTANCVWVEKAVRPTSDTPAEITVTKYTTEPGSVSGLPMVVSSTTEHSWNGQNNARHATTNGPEVVSDVGQRGRDSGTMRETLVTTTQATNLSGERTSRRTETVTARQPESEVAIAGFMSPTDAINLYQSEAATRAALADKQIAFDRTRDGFEQRNVVGTNGAMLPNQYNYGGMFGDNYGWQDGLSPSSQRMMQRDALQNQLDGGAFAPPARAPGSPAGQPVMNTAGQANGQPQPVSANTSEKDEQIKKLDEKVTQLSEGFAAFMDSGAENTPVTQIPANQKGVE
jgi:hypothetical protein